MKIVIVDYGMGNIRSLISSFNYIGVNNVLVSNEFETLKSADRVILPGVGSFYKAMSQIKEKKIDLYLKEIVIKQNKPILGICLGMQLLGESSSEDGQAEGLNFVEAYCEKFTDMNIKVPHVGFNQVDQCLNSKIFSGITNKSDFYFTHSFKMKSNKEIGQSFCNYGSDFIASFELKNIVGVQFHPELSQKNGLKLLRNFIERF